MTVGRASRSVRPVDERGVSVVVGAMMIIAFVTLAMGMYATQVVPADNHEQEVTHSRAVQEDLQQFERAALSASMTGNQEPVTVQLGMHYDSRLLGMNPPPVTGYLSTSDPHPIVVENAEAVDPHAADFWDGSAHRFDTVLVSYDAEYTRYRNGPIVYYEHSLLVSDFGGDQVVRSDQSLVDGRQINLATLTGNVSEASAERASFTFTPVSGAPRTISLTDDAGPITLRLPTRASRTSWEEALQDQRTGAGGHVQSIGYTTRSGRPNLATIRLEPGVTYNARIGRATIGRSSSSPAPAYVKLADRPESTIDYNASTTFGVEVRDRFNTPVSGVDLTAHVTSGPGSASLVPGETLADGTVDVVYEAPSSGSSTKVATITVAVAGSSTGEKRVSKAIKVVPKGNGSGRIISGLELKLDPNNSSSGVNCPTEDRCTINPSRADQLDLKAKLSPPISGKSVWLDLDDYDHGFIYGKDDGKTNSSGVEPLAFVPGRSGDVTMTAEAAGATDQLVIEVTNDTKIDPVLTELQINDESMFGTCSGPGGTGCKLFPTAVISYEISDPDDQFGSISIEVTNVRRLSNKTMTHTSSNRTDTFYFGFGPHNVDGSRPRTPSDVRPTIVEIEIFDEGGNLVSKKVIRTRLDPASADED